MSHGPSIAPSDWRRAVSAKRASIANAIPPAWRLSDDEIPSTEILKDLTAFITRFLSPLEQQITTAPVSVLTSNICSFQWSAVEITRAFCHRAALAHQLTPCLSEICFAKAEQRAEELDTILRTSGQVVGPLHGIPVSLKDRFHMEGLDSACGYVSWLEQPKSAVDEGVLVRRLKEAGAVIFAKTNVPMSMLIGETTNNIVGSTMNPFNRDLSAGGACGGEAALLALRGSPIGWGTDIAGSIRIPCGFNSLYGIRPSFGRISATGLADNLSGLPTAASVVGPLSSDLPSLIQSMKWIINCNAWQEDIETIDMPWRDDNFAGTSNRICQPGQSNGSLVFAILNNDGEVNPHPPVQRALGLVRNALLQRGYEVVDWSPGLKHDLATDVLFQILGSTAGKNVRAAIEASGEPPIHQLADLFKGTESKPLPTSQFWDLCAWRKQFQRQYHDYWRSTRELTASKRAVDGVIMPIAPHTAAPEGSFKYYAYSAVPSVLDYTTGVVPVTFADQYLDYGPFRYIPMSDKDRVNWNLYDKELFDGAPVGVQVMGQRLQEEKVLAMMSAVNDSLQQYQPL
ncbi:amidase signature domain-containing protein [Alternaria rosae]|uniref:amidase signature domain-containing protein n=1 Tax=Alternaria rosae TaxID=1187941 RepID=UPI001E8D81E6|nr:amidase signature domain-containing protein [Alternaria rosae]XP_046026371.1 amidase signature domain-containing protein [Alternaria rosae]KAH6864999.1 amidase signature domain-containing protein [Alternaria rosae]KAH6872788.1 amidase signature domain-containing protein [Alternaria rosae]